MNLGRTVAVRLLVFAASLFVASIAIFLVVNALPGDVATAILGFGADPASVTELRARLGLDRPLLVRYLSWAGGMVSGDMGRSYLTNESVTALVAPRIVVTAWLVGISMLLAACTAPNPDFVQNCAHDVDCLRRKPGGVFDGQGVGRDLAGDEP